MISPSVRLRFSSICWSWCLSLRKGHNFGQRTYGGPTFVIQPVNCCLQHQHTPWGYSFESWLFEFVSSPAVHACRESFRRWSKCLGPRHLHGMPAYSHGIQTLAWQSSSCCTHLESRQVSGRVCVCIPFSVVMHFKWILNIKNTCKYLKKKPT